MLKTKKRKLMALFIIGILLVAILASFAAAGAPASRGGPAKVLRAAPQAPSVAISPSQSAPPPPAQPLATPPQVPPPAGPAPPAAAPTLPSTKLNCLSGLEDTTGKTCGYNIGDNHFCSGDGKTCWINAGGKWVALPTNTNAQEIAAGECNCKSAADCNNDCFKQLTGQEKTHAAFLAWVKEQRKFTFSEGVELGTTLWGLGEKYGFFTEADNPMSQLNAYFTQTKEGLMLSGNWEKSICWQATDFQNPNDGLAFVPGTETVGAWVSAEYTPYRHPSIHDPSKMITEYIYRITSSVNPRGLTINSGASPCYDVMDFQYSLGGAALDLNLDGNTDIIRLLCDSNPYSLTGESTIIRYSSRLYGKVCIHFITIAYMKQGFMQQLINGDLCAPIVATGTQTVTSCPYCPPILTGMGAIAIGHFGATTGPSPAYSAGENRPGVANPTPG